MQIFALARDLLEKYATSEAAVIWERDSRPTDGIRILTKEIEDYRAEIDRLEALLTARAPQGEQNQ